MRLKLPRSETASKLAARVRDLALFPPDLDHCPDASSPKASRAGVPGISKVSFFLKTCNKSPDTSNTKLLMALWVKRRKRSGVALEMKARDELSASSRMKRYP